VKINHVIIINYYICTNVVDPSSTSRHYGASAMLKHRKTLWHD